MPVGESRVRQSAGAVQRWRLVLIVARNDAGACRVLMGNGYRAAIVRRLYVFCTSVFNRRQSGHVLLLHHTFLGLHCGDHCQ